MVSNRRTTVASRTLADQLQPVLDVHTSLRGTGYARFDVERARTRVRSGRPAFDAAQMLVAAGDLRDAFVRTAEAFEHTGMASTTRIVALKQTQIDPTALVLAWANAESQPVDPTLRLARRIAGLVGNAVLSRAAADVLEDFPLGGWKWPRCPCCGGSPDLALATETRRTLVCWRCDTMW